MKRTAKRIAVICFCLCATLYVAPDRTSLALDSDKELAQYSHNVWRTESGLPQNTVRSIAQTRDGYIWLATDGGLVRFDGTRFVVFDRHSDEAIKSDSIQNLLEDHAGNLWVGTDTGLLKYSNGKITGYSTKDGLANDRVSSVYEDRAGALWIGTPNGLSRFRDGRFTSYTTSEGLPSNTIGAIYEDGRGNLWVSTLGGLARLDGEHVAAIYAIKDGLPANNVSAIYESRDGSLWLGTPGGLVRFAQDRFTVYTTRDGLANNLVWSIHEDREGTLWIGTDGGLSRLTNGKFATLTIQDGLADNSVYSIYEDRAGSLWLATGGGLTRWRAGKLASFTTREGLSGNVVLSVLEDREGNLWVGTESGGLDLFKDKKFTTYTASEGLASDLVWAVYETRDGAMWMGTQSGLTRIRNEKSKTFTTKEGLASNIVRALKEDRMGALWIGTPAGLCRLQNDTFDTYTVLDGLSSNAVWAIEEDRAGALWIGTLGGLTQLKDGKFTVYNTEDGLSDDAILALGAGADGTLWIGTRSGGLNRFKDGKFTSQQQLSDNSIHAIYEDADGALWIGTRNGGLNRLKDGKLVACTTKNGLFDDCVFQILDDGKDNLWMSCTKGVFRASRQQLDDFADGKIQYINSISYGMADGMKSRECTGGGQPAGWRSRDGQLWFPTIKGVAMIDPQHLKLNEQKPPVVIEQVIADDKPIDTRASAELAAGVYRLEFQYTGLSFVAPEKVRFKYKLEGFDRDWVEAGARRVAYFTSVPPGHYTFRVMASNNDGVWNEEGAAFAFYIEPRFYQTYWFYLLLLVIAGFLGWTIYHLRIKRIKAQFAAVLVERSRLARDIHDTLAQGFVGISLQIEAVGKMLDKSPAAAKQHLDLAQSLITHSLSEARRSVWDLRAQALESADLATALADEAKRLTAGTTVRAEFHVTGAPRPLPATVESNLLRIGQEAMTNVMKHAKAERIRVELAFEPKQVGLRVKDDGCGFEAQGGVASADGHFGLIGMRERAERLRGKLAVESHPGAGTEIIVTAPAD
jgi:ligand-binding sensor domain-containing protein/signal transduction histidine kinase